MLHLFQLILTYHPDVDKEIKATIDFTPNVLRHMLQFFSCAHFVGSSCECHVCDDVIDCHCGLVHETFSYVRVLDNGIDNDMFGAILNVLREVNVRIWQKSLNILI